MVDISTRYDTSLRRRDTKLILKQRGVSCLYAIAFYKAEMSFFMEKKTNAANITYALAQLGGGSKKEGGDGMMKGL